MRYTAFIPFETGGRLYYNAISYLFCGILTSELCFLGLFILKMGRASLSHDIGQIAIILLTLLGTLRYHEFLRRSYFDVPLTIGLPSTGKQKCRVSEKFRSQILRQSDSLTGETPSIWIPKDSEGVSNALLNSVRRVYLSSEKAGICITNCGAVMTDSGQIVLQDE